MQDVKPSGTETDEKAVAAMNALLQTQGFGYAGLGDLWTGCVLQRGLLYQRKNDCCVFVCLGFIEYVGIGWMMETINDQGKDNELVQYYRSPICNQPRDAIGNLQFLTVTGLSGLQRTDKNEEFAGIPFSF